MGRRFRMALTIFGAWLSVIAAVVAAVVYLHPYTVLGMGVVFMLGAVSWMMACAIDDGGK